MLFHSCVADKWHSVSFRLTELDVYLPFSYVATFCLQSVGSSTLVSNLAVCSPFCLPMN